RYDESIGFLEKTLQLNPDHAFALYNLGNALIKTHRSTEAIKYLQKALKKRPDNPDALNNLGITLVDIGEYTDGVLCLRRAADMRPNSAEIIYNLGQGYEKQQQASKAIACYQKAIQLKPDFSSAYNNMANRLNDQGNITKALACYYRALDLRPENAAGTHSNILFMMQYTEPIDPEAIFNQHKRWAQIYALPMKGLIPEHKNDRDPQKRLRIGYVSPDFRVHSVAYFIEPVIASHNREHFEVFCYSTVDQPDNKTKGFEALCDHWRDISEMADPEASDLIHKDSIDILVDLSGHTGNNRLTLFALKPAPIQVTYIGYPGTTGMETMDYRITDPWADPKGKTDHLHTEELIRLPHGFLCYRPDKDAPGVKAPPAARAGFITFGCFNNRSKVSDMTIRVWSEILKKVPGSMLILKSPVLNDEPTKNHLLDLFGKNTIPADRIRILGNIPSKKDHLDLYNSVDIALDTFPYNGTTTTFEALWMGVPVIALMGDIHISRVGYSILSNLGLDALVARSIDEYIFKAVELAHDSQRQGRLRKELRSIMKNSPLMDEQGITHTLEDEYQKMWTKWCNEQQSRDEQGSTGNHAPLKDPIEILIEQGEKMFKQGDLLDAKCAFVRAVEIAPENTIALNNLGVMYWHSGDTKMAKDTFKKVLEIDPEYRDAAMNLEEIKHVQSKQRKNHNDPSIDPGQDRG
ncbi:MAG: tetratricopeptide repeat protein, partial [Thermodesulfobacteriota bacterium]|nr:tetratricopeptide repeat protein [Thermodesulfobacteriota bacterium]